MASPTDLPLRAFICTGCGWLNRGVDGQPPGGHAIQDAETQTYGGPCPGRWKPVIVYDEQDFNALVRDLSHQAARINDLAVCVARAGDFATQPGISVTIHRRPA